MSGEGSELAEVVFVWQPVGQVPDGEVEVAGGQQRGLVLVIAGTVDTLTDSAVELGKHSSRDLDFATRDDAPLPGIAGHVQSAFQAAGYHVELVERPADTLAWRFGCPVPCMRRHWRWIC